MENYLGTEYTDISELSFAEICDVNNYLHDNSEELLSQFKEKYSSEFLYMEKPTDFISGHLLCAKTRKTDVSYYDSGALDNIYKFLIDERKAISDSNIAIYMFVNIGHKKIKHLHRIAVRYAIIPKDE